MKDYFEKEPGGTEGVVSELTAEDLRRAQEILKRLEKVREAIRKTEGKAKWLDKRWLDPIIGFFGEIMGTVGFGDAVTTLGALWIVKQALDAEMPARKIARMLVNVGFDIAVDAIPIVGSIADFFIKANIANVNIMREYAEELQGKHDAIRGKREA